MPKKKSRSRKRSTKPVAQNEGHWSSSPQGIFQHVEDVQRAVSACFGHERAAMHYPNAGVAYPEVAAWAEAIGAVQHHAPLICTLMVGRGIESTVFRRLSEFPKGAHPGGHVAANYDGAMLALEQLKVTAVLAGIAQGTSDEIGGATASTADKPPSKRREPVEQTKPVALGHAAKAWFKISKRQLRAAIDAGTKAATQLSPPKGRKWVFDLAEVTDANPTAKVDADPATA